MDQPLRQYLWHHDENVWRRRFRFYCPIQLCKLFAASEYVKRPGTVVGNAKSAAMCGNADLSSNKILPAAPPTLSLIRQL
jgi:hypothetical protein